MPDLLPIERTAKRPRRKRSFPLDADDVVKVVLERIDTAQLERTDWMNKRLLRYAKLRGWLEERTYPWENCSNQHVPIMQANSLRVKAGLFNAVLGIRPVMTPKTVNKAQRQQAENANHLIDYQVFLEAEGEQRIDAYIADYVDEGTAVAFQAWVKDKRLMYDRRVFPQPDGDLISAMAADILPIIFKGDGNTYTAKDDTGQSWTVIVPNGEDDMEVTVEVYDLDDDKIEVCLEFEAMVFEGPSITVHDLEDIVVPMRCENAQPVAPQNPFGAPFIARLVRVNYDHVLRMQRNGTYDLLTDEDLDAVKAATEGRVPMAVSNNEDAIKSEKDTAAGLTPNVASGEDKQWLTMVEYYGAWDLNGDGLDEEVIFWVLREARKLARARHLTELYPGIPPQRPFADTRFIPVKGEFYGIGLPELMEGLHDLLHVLFNQNIDNGTLANQPFFFYRASSGLKPDIIRLWPGEGYPVDSPQTDVAFPQMPHADQSWSFNMIGLGMQLLERLTQIGPLQSGQVPQGKASALRTLGTTMAILQQGAAMPEQILRRLFMGLSTIWHQIHQMNARFLPKKKKFLITGKPLDQDDAYSEITDPRDIAVPVSFDFQATLLNTNKGMVSQALIGLGSAIINPLTLQMGLVKPEQIYNWAKDLIQANQLDPARYIVKPPGTPEGPRMTFEEALLVIMDNRLPEVAPFEPEGAQAWHQKALEFMQSDQFGLLTPGQVLIFKQFIQEIIGALRAQMQQQQMMQAAQAFSAQLGNQGQGAQPALTAGQPPEMQTQAPDQREIAGANGHAM